MRTNMPSSSEIAMADVVAVDEMPSVTWSAVIAGAVVAAAISIALLVLGSGLGLISMSPWSGVGASATTLSAATLIWMIIIHWIGSSFGGYLTGRLRASWTDIQRDEVFFRDTAHGLLMWAVASLFTATVMASAVFSVVSGSTKVASSLVSGVGMGAGAVQQSARGPGNTGEMRGPGNPLDYYIDTLFRSNGSVAGLGSSAEPQSRGEATRIFIKGLGDGFSDTDKAYLAQRVAAQTGTSIDEARQRVDSVIAQVTSAEQKLKDTADKARKAAAFGAIFTFLAMLIGAFTASAAAALGGRHRDWL